MRITRVYTRAGDDGSTRLGGGQKVSKASARIEACGTVDELNSSIGVVLAGEVDDAVRKELTVIQNDLFHLGSDLCLLEEDKKKVGIPAIEERHVKRLEACMDSLQKELEPLEEFILPGGSMPAARLHVARVVCRRAESSAVRLSREESIGPFVIHYLNRLSDTLFVMARHENRKRGHSEVYWDKKA